MLFSLLLFCFASLRPALYAILTQRAARQPLTAPRPNHARTLQPDTLAPRSTAPATPVRG